MEIIALFMWFCDFEKHSNGSSEIELRSFKDEAQTAYEYEWINRDLQIALCSDFYKFEKNNQIVRH